MDEGKDIIKLQDKIIAFSRTILIPAVVFFLYQIYIDIQDVKQNMSDMRISQAEINIKINTFSSDLDRLKNDVRDLQEDIAEYKVDEAKRHGNE